MYYRKSKLHKVFRILFSILIFLAIVYLELKNNSDFNKLGYYILDYQQHNYLYEKMHRMGDIISYIIPLLSALIITLLGNNIQPDRKRHREGE